MITFCTVKFLLIFSFHSFARSRSVLFGVCSSFFLLLVGSLPFHKLLAQLSYVCARYTFYTHTPYSEANDIEGWGTINCAKSFFQQYRHFGENLFCCCCCCCCCFVLERVCVYYYMLGESFFSPYYHTIRAWHTIVRVCMYTAHVYVLELDGEKWERVDSMIKYGWWCVLQLQNQTHGIQIKSSAKEWQGERIEKWEPERDRQREWCVYLNRKSKI